MTHEEARQHVEQIRREKLAKDSPDLRAALKLLAEELNTKETHFILELLQNAEDNEYDGKQPELTLCIDADDPTGTSSHGCLVVLNNEAGFQPENVRSLCSVGQSTKKNRSNGYIGEKGIGFKSVFRVTDSPHIFSNGFQFRFHVPAESEGLGYILPHWVEHVPAFLPEGFTAILLPLQPGKRELIAQQLSKIAPETTLFLRKVKRLSVGEGRLIARDDRRGSLVTLRSNDEESLYFVHGEPREKPQNFAEEKRPGISLREVTIALPLKASTPCNGRIFAFLPTEFDSGLPFLVNADFILNSNRERVLEDRRWNQWLRDEIAPTFVQAFLSVLENDDWKAEAHRFLPELNPVADFIQPAVKAIQTQLQSKPCVLADALTSELPRKVFVPGPLARRILANAPRERMQFALLHPAWESRWQERLKPLGVQSLTFAQLFEACGDDSWLKSRDAEWWETLFELCTKCDVSAQTVGLLPILRCQDGICRPLSSRVFANADSSNAPVALPADWPPAHLLDAELQARFQQKPAVWEWLVRTAGLRPFSIQSYITDKLLDWMRQQRGESLLQATRFIADNIRLLDGGAKQALCARMPWLLADGSVLFPEQRAGRELVTPECLEGDTGWNRVFDTGSDRQHFWVVSDIYVDGQPEAVKSALRGFMKEVCGATDVPAPARLRQPAGYNDWGCPQWLCTLNVQQPPENLETRIAALERWIGSFKHFTRFLIPSDGESRWERAPADSMSMLGNVLRTRRWLRSTKKLVTPPVGFADDPEIREFLQDTVPYVQAKLSPELLSKLGVHLRLTVKTLIDLLRQMRESGEVHKPDIVRIYQRLQTMEFDRELFRKEQLVYLDNPQVRWMKTESVVWNDAGDVFDDDFGYASLTYGKSELHGFFTETLRIPAHPELSHYATAWRNLWLAASPDRQTVERKLKVILLRLADSQSELSNSDWWRELNPQLQLWTNRGEFQPPARVYVPDHAVAVELFTDQIQVAFPPKPSRAVLEFLRSISCRSLEAAVQARLVGTEGEAPRLAPAFLTPAAKELCVLFMCSYHGWEGRCSQLQALHETVEISVKEITVEYWLTDYREAGTRPQPRDAHWDGVNRRLLLREGVDAESLRDAAAKSIAAEFFGEAASAEMQAEFFRVLMVGLERARKLMRERNKWRLTPQQQAWFREQGWQVLITELDEIEQPPAPRALAGVPPLAATPPPPAAASSPPSSAESTATSQDTGGTGNQIALSAPDERSHETTRSDSPVARQEQEHPSKRASDDPLDLHDPTTTRARFVEVRAYTRSAPVRSCGGTANTRERDSTSGLASATPEGKADLEQKGREFAANELTVLGYNVKLMDKRNPGFDLRATKGVEILKVEVKSHAREANSVFVTQREREEYETTLGTNREMWELWNVENLAKSSGQAPTIQRVKHIPDSAWKESGYWVNLRQCGEERPKSDQSESSCERKDERQYGEYE